ncbi:MAG TPA: CPBP family intramembrane glutamic endopeptidase [Terriglobales bacterium]|nr:CPBP family intramembrane glutamic endopeptidase [Terriglobales bacterium]
MTTPPNLPEIPPSPPEPVPPSSENPPWTLWDVAILGAVTLAVLGILLFMAVGVARHYSPGVSAELLLKSAKVIIPAQVAGYVLVLLCMVALVRVRGLRFWKGIGWFWPDKWYLPLALGLALSISIQLLSVLLPIPKQLPIEEMFSDTLGVYLLAIFGVTVAPLMEELFFRGLLYPALARRVGIVASVIVTSLLFTSVHASQLARAWAPLLLLFTVALALTITRVRTRSVASSFLVHVGYNFGLFTALFIATSGFRNLENMR